jgi:hypothetical protein
MSDVFDRLARGPQGGQSQGYDNWNEMVGAAPPDRFNTAAQNAMRDLDPDEYYNHTQPGIGGTDPLGALQPQQRSGLAQSLLGALMGAGLGRNDIGQGAGIQNLDPSRMSPQDLAALAQYAQRTHPEALGQVAQENRDDPNLLESLLGNKAVLALAAGLTGKFLYDQAQKQKAQQQAPAPPTSHRRGGTNLG